MKRTSPSLQIFKPAIAATLATVIMCGFSVRSAQAGYIVTLEQVGSDVVATGTGALDLTGLTFVGTNSFSAEMWPLSSIIQTGATPPSVSEYVGPTGPTSFGSGGPAFPSSSTGDLVGMINSGALILPVGYVSGTALSDTSTYNSASFSSLGVTPGIYEWTWGTGANQNFTLDAVAPAVPDSGSTFGLLSLSVVALLGATRLRFLQQLAA